MSAPVFVSDLDFEPVVVLRSSCTLAEAASALAATDTGVALVATTPMKEITERDVVAMVGAGVDTATALEQLDLRSPCLLRPGASVDEALTMMIVTGRRAAVVADEEQPLGVIRLADAIATRFQSSSWTGALGHALHMNTET